MELATLDCTECGESYGVGQWPYCPHGTVATYRPFETYLDTNIAENPVEITSDRQREKLMKKNGLSERPREHVDDLNERRGNIGLPPLRK
jgi:hypothetical protein